MDNEKLQEEVVSQIRACLVSTKGKCDLRQIRSDYRMLMGGEIPFRDLGYQNLEQFICSVPTLSTSRTANGDLLVDAKMTDKSSHIVQFVDKQKAGKKKTSHFRFPPRQVPHYNFRGISAPRWRPKNVNSNWKKSYQSSPRPAAVSHNQFINIPSSPKSSNVAPRLTNRLQVKKESERPPNVEAAAPVVEKHELQNGSNSLFTKAKKRLVQRMADINIDTNNVNMNGDSVLTDNWVSKSEVTLSSPSIKTNWISKSEQTLTPPALSSSAIRDLQQESLAAAADFRSPVWGWSSSDDSPEKGGNVKIGRLRQNNIEKEKMEFTGDHLEDLFRFARVHRLGEPVVKISSRKIKKKPVCYDCVIRIGSYQNSSYPDDCPNEVTAQQIAAKNLMDEIVPKYSKRKSLLISNESEVLERIPPIVKLHHHGVWNWQIEADYAEMFNEQLPINWLEVVDSIACISVQPIMNKFVLRFCKPDEKGNVSPLIVANVSVPSNTVKFDDDNLLLADITCLASAGEIWCRQIETSEANAFTSMIMKMEEYYNLHRESEIVSRIDIGGYYVALYDSMWFRVRVIDVNSNNVSCFCIDFGDEWIVPKENIFRLNRQYAKEQAQAFVCRLAGVEELYEASKSSEYFNSLIGKVVQIQVDPNTTTVEKSDPNDPALSVVLYDTETGIVVNEHLITRIGIESASPTLNKSAPTEVYVTHALKDGSVYVQVHSKGFDQLNALLKEAEQNILNGGPDLPKPVLQPKEDELYFVQANDKCWYRAKIIDWDPERKYAQLFLVDNGEDPVVTVNDRPFYLLDDLGDIISKFPYQALKVQMVVNSLPSDFVQKIKNLMPREHPVLLKLHMTDPVKGPLVDFFKRSETDNVLFSVNTSISTENEFKNMLGDGNNNSGKPPLQQSTKLQRLISLNQFDDATRNVPSSGALSCPPLPKVGEFLDVRIPCAVHPNNFFVQPYESQEKLTKMMAALQEKCNETYHSPIPIQDVLPGKIYASRHEDGKWYRTSVIKVIHSGSISVFYCDFGYYANLTLQQLVPLSLEFIDLPHQAIKAKLAGIQPKNSKWSMDDCRFFEELVCRKCFVSVLVGIEKDILYRSDTVLSLKLIDTSTTDDVHIDKVLIMEGIAVDSAKLEQ